MTYSLAAWERDQENLPGGPGELSDEEQEAADKAREEAEYEAHMDREEA